MRPLTKLRVLMCASLLLAACGGGGGGGSSSPKPTADAGDDLTVQMGDTVALDGSASSSPRDGAALSYQWTLVAQPESSEAELVDADTAYPSFVADFPGEYEVDLLVNDGTRDSNHDRLMVTATNPDPVAVAQTEYSELVGTTVALDGSNSLPPTGGDAALLEYEWTLVSQPATSTAELTTPYSAVSGLYTDTVGSYLVTLLVRYDGNVSNTLEIEVMANLSNTKPTADAGGPYTIERGQTLTLDGTGSSDADGDDLSYRWYMYMPGNSNGYIAVGNSLKNGSALRVESALDGADTATPTITPDVAGDWQVHLVVYDGTAPSGISTARITVNVPEDAENTPPVASENITQRTDAYSPVYSQELELGGAGYVSGNSWDLDGDDLTQRYRWVSTPEGFEEPDLNAMSWPYFSATHEGEYLLEIIANDGQADSAPLERKYIVRTGANRAPRPAVAPDSITLSVGEVAWFDGRGSSDQDGDSLTYHWLLFDKPDGSAAELQYENVVTEEGVTLKNARAGVLTDKPGIYIAWLWVTDSHGVTTPQQTISYGKVMAKGSNSAPTVERISNDNAHHRIRHRNTHFDTEDQPYIANGEPLTFHSVNVVDPDLDTLYYLWTLSQPEGSDLTDAADTADFYSGIAQVPGRYTASFLVSDGIDTSAEESISFDVVAREDYPSLLLEDFYSASDKNSWDRHVSQNSPGVTFPVQKAFPYWLHDSGSFPISHWRLELGDNIIKSYRLTAYGGDYTITNLVVEPSENADFPEITGKIVGLTNGQVIEEGETVEFSLIMNLSGNIDNSGNGTDNVVEGLSYQFDVAEKPGWSFEYRPHVY